MHRRRLARACRRARHILPVCTVAPALAALLAGSTGPVPGELGFCAGLLMAAMMAGAWWAWHGAVPVISR